MGRRLTSRERQERKEFKNLLRKIRKTKKYGKWKLRILKREVKSYPKIPKGVQVHHKTELSKLLNKYDIKSVEEALQCAELWDTHLGICLKRGEHFIWTKLGRYKYLTKGFISLLEGWMGRCKIDHLDADKKRRPRKRRNRKPRPPH
uniref:Uncharacterized protein n=1 Tax=viral metagenome TaxID=1070528 RepID=A0A6H2A578_9ZZZZ